MATDLTTESGSVDILVIGEDVPDAWHATELADRVLREQGPEWLRDALDHVRRWRGIDDQSPLLRWREIKAAYDARRLPRQLGHTLDPATPVRGADAAIARKVALLSAHLRTELPDLRALLVIRDLDHQPQRREALELCRSIARNRGIIVLLATPEPKREAWVLHGFDPESAEESGHLDVTRRSLGFDPRVDAHRLRGDRRHATGQRDAKSIVEKLTGGDPERVARCWLSAPLDRLAERGTRSHLATFLDEVRTELHPLMTGQRTDG